ncbi:MAG: hypothetical protein H7257_15095 [Taibaiella sp.]|nr:hypothetical protein [Taibaiella sp.]
MSLPLAIAEKLQLLTGGEQLPASRLKHPVIEEMLRDEVLQSRLAGRTKSTLYLPDTTAFANWLYNRYNIRDLELYIRTLQDEELTRGQLVQATGDSKAAVIRTFKGFLINSYMPVHCTLGGEPYIVQPVPGTFSFMYDYERFVPSADVTIVGIENAENFRHIAALRYLFDDIKPLFVCRYPQGQSRDMIKWLLAIPNPYLHFGDYDFAGINIYQQEFRRHLQGRATFFIPPRIEVLLEKYGNPALYDRQQLNEAHLEEEAVQYLITLLHRHKKGLEQEVFLRGETM